MASTNFSLGTHEILQKNNNKYTNARYSSVLNNNVGTPFPLYKQSGAYFTDWQPSGSRESSLKQEFNIPLNNTFFRNTLQKAGVGLINSELSSWQNRTQTLTNNGSTLSCATDSDCDYWKGTKCNSNFMTWDNAKGNQTNYCSVVYYPELIDNVSGNPSGVGGGGVYTRKSAQEGGIGKKCQEDNNCAQDYFCNNKTTLSGSNIQQTGYCSMKYTCPDNSVQFLGTPYNSGIPIPPPLDQNNNGKGYLSKQICDEQANAQQDCVPDRNGKWYAVYPGYCPIPKYLRNQNNPSNSYISTPQTSEKGFTIPHYATNKSSSMTSVDPFNLLDIEDGTLQASKYLQTLDTLPENI